MITRRTKVQLVIFLVITLLGVSFVGARYARLDTLFFSRTYTVHAHFADSGGIFSQAEVTYRGVTIGRVGRMKLTSDGVDVNLEIDNSNDNIPANTEAIVGNRSAVGEQFVELQPNTDSGPYLKDGSVIQESDTSIPISSTKWLLDTDKLVRSVPRRDLRVVINEFGKAFHNGGDDLTRLIDTSSSFIDAANRNFGITTKLINQSNVVLNTQLDKASDIRSFAHDLSLFTTTLAAHDPDLRRVIENGSATANQLRTFLEQNKVDLAKLFNNLVTTGQIQLKHLAGTRMLLILYPYVVAGGFVVNAPDGGGVYDAHFGMILQQNPPVCHHGYESTHKRDPNHQRGNAPMNMKAHCAEPASQSNPRGAQHAPRVAPDRSLNPGPSVATYDRKSGKLRWNDGVPHGPAVTYTGGAGAAFGRESWKWLLLQPLMPQQ